MPGLLPTPWCDRYSFGQQKARQNTGPFCLESTPRLLPEQRDFGVGRSRQGPERRPEMKRLNKPVDSSGLRPMSCQIVTAHQRHVVQSLRSRGAPRGAWGGAPRHHDVRPRTESGLTLAWEHTRASGSVVRSHQFSANLMGCLARPVFHRAQGVLAANLQIRESASR
jgi:hypothetical protein